MRGGYAESHDERVQISGESFLPGAYNIQGVDRPKTESVSSATIGLS